MGGIKGAENRIFSDLLETQHQKRRSMHSDAEQKQFPLEGEISERQARMQIACLRLRNRICSTLETLEKEVSSLPFPGASLPGEARFVKKRWVRNEKQEKESFQPRDAEESEGGGGEMALLSGRLFEKAGVHLSTVYGVFSEAFRGQIPGTSTDPRFWASGLSLIIHPAHPHVPAVHLNLRMVVTTQQWFGGGVDLTPMLAARRTQEDPDSCVFHKALEDAFTETAPLSYTESRAWCDRYFYLPHRKEPRGIGGVFFDYVHSRDWESDFAFLQGIGEAFLLVYPVLVRRNREKPWTESERAEQLQQRGRYVEFNLLYDRGTLFGLKTGGSVESILSSLPPLVAWPA